MGLDRRQFLAACGGGAGLTLLGCRRPFGRTIQGGIAGPAHARGHLLRGALDATPRRREETAVVIAGGGVAGLSAAWALGRAGFDDYVVLELEDVPGGTARSGEGAVTPYPWGAHYVAAPPAANRPLVALLDEVGAVAGRDERGEPVWAEEVLCREPEERLFLHGTWQEGLFPRLGAGRDDLAELDRFGREMAAWAARCDAAGRSGFTLPRALGSEADEFRALDRASMAEYLAGRGFRSERLRWFVEYACRDDFGTSLRGTSAWAGVHYFASRLASAGGSDGSDGSEPESAPLLTWPEGNGRLVHHLAAIAGGRIRTGAIVAAVTPRTDGADVVYLDAASGEARLIAAGDVVFALPRFLARHVVVPWRSSPPPHLAEAVYGSWMVANLTLAERPRERGFPLAWDNVLMDSRSLGYVVATHQSGRDHGPTVLTYYLPFPDGDPSAVRRTMLATSWETWVERILADLKPAHPDLRALVERVDVFLWGHAMVRPRPGFLWSDALAASRRPLGRIHFAHTDLSGMALFEEAQYWGIRAAEAILARRGHAFSPWLDPGARVVD